MARAFNSLSTAFGLALGLAIAHGMGVLAFPLILPAMQTDMGWTYAEGGWLASACAAGFGLGLAASLLALRRMKPAWLFQLGMVAAVATLIATGAARDLAELTVLRAMAGFAAAPMLIGGAVLATSIYTYQPDRSARMLAVFHGGSAGGVLLGGVGLPMLMLAFGPRGWPEMWLTLGLVASVCLPFCIWASQRVVTLRPRAVATAWPWLRFRPALAAYGLFSAGSLMLLTFLVLCASQKGANGHGMIAIWTTLGLAGMLAGSFWHSMLRGLAPGQRVAATIAMTLAGTMVVLGDGPPAALVVAAAMIGFGMFMVPVTVTQLIEEQVPREAQPAALSSFLLVNAAGQVAGPMTAGWISDTIGSLFAAPALAAGLLCLATLLALLQGAVVRREFEGGAATLAKNQPPSGGHQLAG